MSQSIETVYVVEELDQVVEGREVWVNVDEWDDFNEAEADAMAESLENETGRTRVVRVTREVVKAYRKGVEA